MTPFTENRKIDLRFNEPELAAELAPDWDIVHYQVEKGAYETRFQAVYTSRMQMVLTRCTVSIFGQGAIPRGTGVIGIPLEEERYHYCGGRLGADEIQALAMGEEFEIRTRGATTILTLAVDMDLLQKVARECTGYDYSSLITGKRLNVRAEDLARLKPHLTRLLTRLHAGNRLHLDPRQQHLLEREVLETVFMHVRANNRDLRMNERLQAARLAREYICNNLGSDLDISRLCEITGCAKETLHKGFRERYGMSPGQYTRILRLNRVHAELLENPSYGRVTDIAMKWGFTHMGRFAGYYRQLFDESPSRTMRKQYCILPRESYPASYPSP